uniref:Synaptobrevin, longin-like domain protein n=1 Tax=Tanacetum cinerariifolium TaxID=118510 RepID=A0A6L2P851_TANCI|nr:synaptobrevin, longin-like domain protein [Tanacetum cinerariifolium]
MATLKFCDSHNMIAYLNKTEGSEGFHQIVVFLNSSHIKFALSENPTIYTLLIQQFWQTTIANTLDTREIQITATIDGNVKLISDASIRRHLKLEDSDGISTLSNTKIFEQLALMGYASNSNKLTIQKGHFSPQWRFLIHNILYCLSPKKTDWEQFSSNIATAIICLATNRTFNFSKTIFEGMGEGSTVLVESHHTPSGDPPLSQPRHSSPSRVPTSAHNSPLLRDATRLHTYSRRRRAVSTGRGGVSTASRIISIAKETVSTAGVLMPVSTADIVQESTSLPRATKDKGKAIMTESEPEQTTTKKPKDLDAEIAQRLQEEIKVAKRQRMAQEHQAAQTFTKDKWENIRARVKANEELTQKLQAEEREKYSKDERTKMLIDLINHRKKYTLKQLKKLSFKEIKELFEATMRRIQDFVLMEKEGDKEVSKLVGAGGSKRDAEEEVDQGSFKKQKTDEASGSVQEQLVEKEKELSQEDLQ